MSIKVKRITAIMLAAAMLVNSSALFASAEDNNAVQNDSPDPLKPICIDNNELFSVSECDSDFNCLCLTNEIDDESEKTILNIEDYLSNEPIPYSNDDIINDEGVCGDNAKYIFSDNTLTILGEGEIENYSSYFGAPWATYRNKINTIEISNKITQIGEFSFAGLTNLTTIKSFEMQNGVKRYIGDTNEITSNIKNINVWAFRNCTSLTSISISAETIQQQAFYNCGSLEKVELKDGIKKMEAIIFLKCPNIKKIYIPASLSEIWCGLNKNPFIGMSGLSYIEVDKNNSKFSNDNNGFLYNKDRTELIFVPQNCSVNTLTLNSKLKSIHTCALWDNNKIINIISNNDRAGNNILNLKEFPLLTKWHDCDSVNDFTDTFNNHYFVIGGFLINYIKDENSNGTLNTEDRLKNCKNEITNIKAVRLIESKYYDDIYNIAIGRDIELYPKTFDRTNWYKSNQINNMAVIYETLSPTSSTYSRLYRYNSSSNRVNLSNYDEIEGYAFEGKTDNDAISISIDSNNAPQINHEAFVDAKIFSIVVDNDEWSYSDFKFNRDDIILSYENNGMLKDENSLKAQLVLAILKSSETMEIYESKFCKSLINEMGWKELAEKDPYEAVYAIQKWINSNSTYTSWLSKAGYFDKVDYSFNNIDYTGYLDMSAHTFGNLSTGYIVCGGFSNTIKDIIKNLESSTLKCIGIGSPTHAFAMIGVKEQASQSADKMVWYYTEPQNEANLQGQDNFGVRNNIYYGYRKEDLNVGKIKETLEQNHIYYSYTDENGETIVVNDNGESGTLSSEDYVFPSKKNVNVVIHKVISEPDNDIDISLSLPKYVCECKYQRQEISQGYKLYTDIEHNIDLLTIIITPCYYENKEIGVGISEELKHPNVIYGNVYELADGYRIYLYGKYDGRNLIITVSDEDQLQLNKKMFYKINDYAGIGNIAIRANNWGELYNYSRNIDRNGNYVNMTDYAEITKYTDFSGCVSLAGVDVFDFDDPDVGTYYGTAPVTEFGVKEMVGYYITVTQNSETKEKYIDIKTYQTGDLNLNGCIDTEDLTLLSRYLVKGYQFIQTGSDGNLTFNASNITVNGDIAANGTMNILGGVAHINGTLTARHLNDAVGGSSLTYKKVDEDEEAFPVDVITDTFSDENMMNWYFSKEDMQVYDFTEQTDPGTIIYGMSIYPDRDMEEIKSTYSKNGALWFQGGFNVTGNINATYGISVDNAEQFKISSVVYSEKGDINITADKVTINGFIYAPNGNVTITSDDLNITGTIVAKELEIESSGNLNFNVASLDITGVAQLSEFQLMLADLNGDEKINVIDSTYLRRKLLYQNNR
ncbi:leucine-rich repeat protein [Porcipelethomonas sp.]|uniref:leucine-rich repeat protein n=1 Tax=Porcipelethomonas sp. TaxID=2981675 RepID=UPI0030772633